MSRNTASSCAGIFTDGLGVVDRVSGLRIIDVSRPRAPAERGTLGSKQFTLGLSVVGHTAYLASRTAGLRIVDVSNPERPVSVHEIDTPGEAWDVAVEGERAYVADGSSGVQILDVARPR